MWAKRLQELDDLHFMSYLESFLSEMQIEDILKLSVNPESLADEIPLFYKQVLHAWYTIKDEPSNVCDILSEVIWYNRYIQIDENCIMYDQWYKHGIVYVYDLINENGKFCTYAEFVAKYGIHCSQFKYMAFIDSIPQKWKFVIRHNREMVLSYDKSKLKNITQNIGHSVKDIDKLKSCDIYWKLIDKIFISPTCITSWQRKYGIIFEEKQWKCIFELPHKIAKSVRVREFQAKIIHRVYASNSYVSHFDKTVSEMCLQCNVKCDICHMFFLCKNVKPFWTNFEHWYSSHIKTLKLDLITVIFGELVPNSHLLNFCLLYAAIGVTNCTIIRNHMYLAFCNSWYT